MLNTSAVVVGAGIVGLSIAYALIEPNIKCLAAVYSPKTSVINVSQYIQTLHYSDDTSCIV